MRYFSGTLSRDGQPLGDVLGEIRLVTETTDWRVETYGKDDPKRRQDTRSHYEGTMQTQGWMPHPDSIGGEIRLDAGRAGVMDVKVTHWSLGVAADTITLKFLTVGDPVVMPSRPSLVPATPQGVSP